MKSYEEIIKGIEDAQLRETPLEFNVGDTVKVSALGSKAKQTFTVRKNSNGVGVEKTWPVNSPLVEKVVVVRRGKARRAKLYYLRDRVGKAAKVKEIIK